MPFDGLTLKRRFRRFLGSSVEFDLAPYMARLARIDRLATEVAATDDAGLTAWARRLKTRVGEGVSLDQVLDELFALVREASERVLGTRPFDEQIVGGLAMHQGKIAEMQTGEGKTLAAVAAVALNALPGHGVQVLTFNDHLARRKRQALVTEIRPSSAYGSAEYSDAVVRYRERYFSVPGARLDVVGAVFVPDRVQNFFGCGLLLSQPFFRRQRHPANSGRRFSGDWRMPSRRPVLHLTHGYVGQRHLHAGDRRRHERAPADRDPLTPANRRGPSWMNSATMENDAALGLGGNPMRFPLIASALVASALVLAAVLLAPPPLTAPNGPRRGRRSANPMK